MIELLDKSGITCNSRCEILYLSNFMEKNNLLRYSNIYYKTNIRITFPLSLEDLKDLEDFLKINKYLKTIHINKLINSELENLVNILIKYNRHNLKIIIHENLTDEKQAEYLKNKNKQYKKKYKIYLSLEYSKEYLDKNIFKQAMTNTLKICGLIISSIVILIVTYIGVSNYIAEKQVDSIKQNLAEVIEVTDPTEIIKEKNEENIEIAEEGCLSFPGIFAEVERSAEVRLTYQDTDGAKHVLVCSGLFARCVQHENDHLDGVCFVDRLTPRQLFKIEPKLKKLRRQTRDFLKSQKSH